jgi:predicted MPP superfamily phosphohydrolase
MKTINVILFITIFFTVLGLISFYIYIRGLQSIPQDSSLRHAYTLTFWIVALSFPAGRLLEKVWPSAISDLLIWMGSFWLAALLYFLIAIVLLDLLRFTNHFMPFFPRVIADNYPQAKYLIAAGVLGGVGLLLLGGHINSVMPRIKQLNLVIAKKTPHIKKLNVAVVTDIHLGTIIGRSRFDLIVDKINRLDPDLVLLPGDIVDEDLAPVIKQNLGESLLNIKSRFGVYASTGNHEYIGGVEKACDYLTKHNITMLRDRSIKIDDSFFLVGREDRSMSWATERQRKDLADLMAEVDKSYPIILMDHQPFALEEAAQQGVDLQLSGHTHNAQMWPLNYIVQSIYKLAWGYTRIGNTHYYVSDGVGTWGPPVRIGSYPEIVNIIINFQF